jgi:hypothetical protein
MLKDTKYVNSIIKYGSVEFPILTNWRNIGISLSGGADSALLAYLICSSTSHTANIHILTNIRMWKTRPWQKYNALDVYNWLEERFPDHKFTMHQNFIPPDLEWGDKGPNITDEYGKLKSGNQIILRSHAEYIAFRYGLDAWFAGVNKNPSEDFKGKLNDRDIKPTEDLTPLIREHMGVTVCHPFIYTTKDWIIKQYHEHDIKELLDLTRSCEGDKTHYPEIFGNLDYKTYIPGQAVPECGKCFWCKEREWAIKQYDEHSEDIK